ncbi:hypothetical protein ACOBQJ_00675 [Pelotomaculum propionicicum]|uniref:hypothetical protein n=1 Tax=Pelotomaculum propionicicum TaxID=258475 RepID=UPI003B7FEF33
MEMDLSYFVHYKSKGADYINRAMADLSIEITDDITPLELFSVFNGIFARAIDIMLEEIKEGVDF